MEVHADGTCRVVYYCASRDDLSDALHEVYHPSSPPESCDLRLDGRINADVHALLDEDLGGFNQVLISSRAEACLDRLEAWANSTPVAVFIEFPDLTSHGAISTSFLTDERGSYAFLRALAVDVQGARYQKHVIPFAVLTGNHTHSSDIGIDSTITSSFLTAGAIDIVRSPLRSCDINRLVGHVKEITRPPAQLLGAPMAQSLVDSIRDNGEPKIARHRPDKSLTEAQRAVVEEAVHKWHFPAQDLDMDELTYAALFMLEQLLRTPELQPYSMPRAQLMTFLLATRRQYKHSNEVYYHNWRHAVDVTQSIFCFLLNVRLCRSNAQESTTPDLSPVERLLTPLDALILLVSAVGHDVGHPGVNNAFLVACNHPLAQLYNDKSVLENYHCAAYSQLLRRHWPSLSSISGFRSTMISTILATDMQRHFEYMSRLAEFKQKVTESDQRANEWPVKDVEQSRELMMSLLIKAADISNVARPFDVSASWAKILMDEFARQGELESELQIPTCLFGGPPDKGNKLAAAESQKGFMNLFGIPLFQGIADIMPSLMSAVKELSRNRGIWDDKIENEKRRRDEDGKDLHLTFSGVSAEEVEEATSKSKSEPMVIPISRSSTPSTPPKKSLVTNLDPSPSRHPAHEHRREISSSVAFDDTKRPSTPLLGVGGVPLSPHATAVSRRSSKDVALDHLHHMSAFPQPANGPGSRRGSADAGWHIHQSYPNSRRGSKDESLTTILVTSGTGGSPGRRRSPASPTRAARSSPTKSAYRKQSIPQGQKPNALRTSVPSSRSNTASTTTFVTTNQPSPSTQPSSLATQDTDDSPTPPPHHPSIPSTEDPFLTPATWPNSPDGMRRTSVNDSSPGLHPSISPIPPIPSAVKSDPDDSSGRGTPRKLASGSGNVRESRSRSRLGGFKFWKRRRDPPSTEAIEVVSHHPL